MGRRPFRRCPTTSSPGVDAIATAGSLEQAKAATRAVLESTGLVMTDDPANAPPSLAGIYFGDEELEAIAREVQAKPRVSRATFADFAMAFGGMALLPPNDAQLDNLPADWPNSDAGAELPELRPTLDVSGLPGRLAKALIGWVNRSLEAHTSSDPDLVALSNAPLYLAEPCS